MAPLSDGRFIVVYDSHLLDGSGKAVAGQIFAGDGSKLGDEIQFNTYTPNYQRSAKVHGTDDGGFIVVWESDGQDGDGDGIFIRRYDSSGQPLAPEEQLNTDSVSHQRTPAIAINGDGDVLGVYESFNSTSPETFGLFFRTLSINKPIPAVVDTDFTTNSIDTYVGFYTSGTDLIWRSEEDPSITLVLNDTKPQQNDSSPGAVNGYIHELPNGNIVVGWNVAVVKDLGGGSTDGIQDVYVRVFDPSTGLPVTNELNFTMATQIVV